MIEEKPTHQHVWAYRGLEYEIGETIEGLEGLGSWRKREYFDVHFCSTCLREKVIPRYVSDSTNGPPIDGSTPRGTHPSKIKPTKQEEPTPIEHPKEHGPLWRGESWGVFPKVD